MGQTIQLCDFDIWLVIRQPIAEYDLRGTERSVSWEGSASIGWRVSTLFKPPEDVNVEMFSQVFVDHSTYVLGQLRVEDFLAVLKSPPYSDPIQRCRQELCRAVGLDAIDTSDRAVLVYLSWNRGEPCGLYGASLREAIAAVVKDITRLNSWAVTDELVIAPVLLHSGPWCQCAIIDTAQRSQLASDNGTYHWPNLILAYLEQAKRVQVLRRVSASIRDGRLIGLASSSFFGRNTWASYEVLLDALGDFSAMQLEAVDAIAEARELADQIYGAVVSKTMTEPEAISPRGEIPLMLRRLIETPKLEARALESLITGLSCKAQLMVEWSRSRATHGAAMDQIRLQKRVQHLEVIMAVVGAAALIVALLTFMLAM